MAEPYFFTGSHNTYLDIAVRGKDHLGLSLQYVLHSTNGMGGLLTRFVAWNPMSVNEIKGFKYLPIRGIGEFKTSDGETFQGVRFTKLVIPVFQPGPSPLEFVHLADKMLVFDVLADWVQERCKEEGFTPLFEAELKEHLKNLVAGESSSGDNFNLVLELPNLQELFAKK
jgi:hypothetical protein